LMFYHGAPGWPGWLDRLECELKASEGGSWLDRVVCRVIDRARIARGEAVVDLGAGTGLVTVRAARAAGPSGTVVAVDASPDCLERLERDCAGMGLVNVSAVTGRLERLPLESSKFDVAVCRSALCYCVDLTGALSEMSRVLVPGGRFSVFEPLMGEMAWNREVSEDFQSMETALKERRASSLDREMLRAAFTDAGLAGLGSLVVHFSIGGKGRSVMELAGEYLYDLPGDLAAFRVLIEAGFAEERIKEAAEAFARLVAAGDLEGTLPCLYAWGEKPAKVERGHV